MRINSQKKNAFPQSDCLETVHASVVDTGTYLADLDAPVVDRGASFGGNHGSRV